MIKPITPTCLRCREQSPFIDGGTGLCTECFARSLCSFWAGAAEGQRAPYTGSPLEVAS